MDAAFLAEFRRTIDRAAERLGTFCDSEAGRPTAPGKWSKKEIVGHLIDSAANNHGRFVRAQLQEDLVFPGYDQDAWVRVQRYRDRPWSDLVALWRAYNRHIACVMESADPDGWPACGRRTTWTSLRGRLFSGRNRRRWTTSCAITSRISNTTCARRWGATGLNDGIELGIRQEGGCRKKRQPDAGRQAN